MLSPTNDAPTTATSTIHGVPAEIIVPACDDLGWGGYFRIWMRKRTMDARAVGTSA